MILMMKNVRMLHMNMVFVFLWYAYKFIDKYLERERFMRYIYIDIILRTTPGFCSRDYSIQHGHLEGVRVAAVPAQEYHHCLAAYWTQRGQPRMMMRANGDLWWLKKTKNMRQTWDFGFLANLGVKKEWMIWNYCDVLLVLTNDR